MKLHLPIVLLAVMSVSVAYATGIAIPTSSIKVDNTVYTSKDSEVHNQLAASAIGTSSHNPEVIVKDGAGELVIDKDVTMNNQFRVREGTVTISGATVTNNMKLGGAEAALSVGGTNANLVLDGGKYVQSASANYGASFALGNGDGAATVELKNKSLLHSDHCLFLGRARIGAYVTPSYKDTSQGETYHEGYADGDLPTGLTKVTVSGKSEMSAGTALYLDHVELTITGEGTKVIDNTRGLYNSLVDPTLNYTSVFGGRNESTTIVKIEDGASMSIQNNGLYVGTGDRNTTTITVSGKSEKGVSSSLSVEGTAYLGCSYGDTNSSSTTVLVKDGAVATFDDVVLGYYENKAASIQVESATLNLNDIMWVGNDGSLSVDEASTLGLALTSLGGGTAIMLTESAKLTIADGATIVLTLSDAVIEALAAKGGAEVVEWNLFSGLTDDDTVGNVTVKTADAGYTLSNVNLSTQDGVVKLQATASIPEPTTATLSLLALAALAARRRRK